MRRLWAAMATVAVLAVALTGCAGYLLDNSVRSFSSLAALPSNPTYRFDRLPSQEAEPFQGFLEALADPALHNAGLRRDDASPLYGVQLSARIVRTLSPWSPADGYGYGWGWGWGWGGGMYPRLESPWFQRDASVIVRELGSNRVVFESYAQNEGPWLDTGVVLAAMIEAAMQGFPAPPPGPRRVDITLGR